MHISDNTSALLHVAGYLPDSSCMCSVILHFSVSLLRDVERGGCCLEMSLGVEGWEELEDSLRSSYRALSPAPVTTTTSSAPVLTALITRWSEDPGAGVSLRFKGRIAQCWGGWELQVVTQKNLMVFLWCIYPLICGLLWRLRNNLLGFCLFGRESIPGPWFSKSMLTLGLEIYSRPRGKSGKQSYKKIKPTWKWA